MYECGHVKKVLSNKTGITDYLWTVWWKWKSRNIFLVFWYLWRTFQNDMKSTIGTILVSLSVPFFCANEKYWPWINWVIILCPFLKPWQNKKGQMLLGMLKKGSIFVHKFLKRLPFCEYNNKWESGKIYCKRLTTKP